MGSSARCGRGADQHVAGDDSVTRRTDVHRHDRPREQASIIAGTPVSVPERQLSAPYTVPSPLLSCARDFCVAIRRLEAQVGLADP